MKKLLIGLLILLNAQFAWSGASRNFDGVSDAIDFTKPSGLVVGTDSFIRMVWFYWTDSPDIEATIFSQQDGTGTGRTWLGIEEGVTCTNEPFYNFLGGAANCSVTDLSVNIWYHGAIMSNETAGTAVVFLNGVQDSSTTETVEAATGNLRTGVHKSNTSEDYEGQIAHNILCEGTLTGEQILEISLNPEIASRAFCNTNLYIYNPFWGLESPEIDVSGNGATGSLTGTAESSNGPPIMLSALPL